MNRTIKAFSALALAIATTVSLAVPANATTVKGDAISNESKGEQNPPNVVSISYEAYQNGKLTAETTVRVPAGWDEENVAMGGRMIPSSAAPEEAVADSSGPAEEIVEEEPSVEGKDDNYTGVPLFDQTLYPDIPFGSSNVADGGCGIVCAAMVISHITGKTVAVDALATEYNLSGKTNLERMEEALSGYHVDFTKTYQWSDVKAALEEGKVAIIMVNEQSKFTGTQHLIVVDHINADGTVMVKDPNGANYRRIDWYMDPLYKNGFPEKEIKIGYCGGWIIEGEQASFEDPFC